MTIDDRRDRTVDVWGARTPHGQGTEWPARVDSYLSPGLDEADVDRWVRSACVLCSNGCGVDIAVVGGEMVGVRGRADDRVNRAGWARKGLYGWQASAATG